MQGDDFSVDPSLSRAPAWRAIMRFSKYLKPGIWAMRLPGIGPLIQKVAIREDEEANWFIPVGEAIPAGEVIPVGEEIPMGERYALPEAVIERLLHTADGLFVMRACPCRVAFHCQDHPQDLGCLHLGPVARQIPSDVGRVLSLDDAIKHLRRALEAGLIPTILHLPDEAEIFGVEKTRMLSVCFCCQCCCDVRLLLREGPDRYWDLYNNRLPGIEMRVSQTCTRCGDCISACYGGERVIQIGLQGAQINARCIGCGLCVPACPEGAITLHVDPAVDIMQALHDRIAERVMIGQGSRD